MEYAAGTAILFFSRSAETESRHKKWFGTRPAANLHIARQLIEITRTGLERTGLPVFHVDETRQKGETFGQKLAYAFAEIFALGYQSVVSVGNDSPGLPGLNWVQIQHELNSGRNVVGPDFRHGAYLIGLRRESFDQSLFENLPWQTTNLLDHLLTYCQNPAILSKKRDVNSWSDLKVVAQQHKALQRLLRLILGSDFPNFEPGRQNTLLLTHSHGLRAPPLF